MSAFSKKETSQQKILKKNTRFAYTVNAPLIIYLLCVLAGPIIWGVSLVLPIRVLAEAHHLSVSKII